MENSIWVGKNCKGDVIASFAKPQFTEDGLFTHNERNLYANCHVSSCFALDLKPLEIVELIFDTETGKVEVKRQRKIGWYLTAIGDVYKSTTAYHWNGVNWCSNRKDGCSTHKEDCITVISEKLPDNEYLKGLE